jgi:hypothetical protein
MLVTPAQMRAVRARLRLERDELADRGRVSLATIRLLEVQKAVGLVPPITIDVVPQRHRIRRPTLTLAVQVALLQCASQIEPLTAIVAQHRVRG